MKNTSIIIWYFLLFFPSLLSAQVVQKPLELTLEEAWIMYESQSPTIQRLLIDRNMSVRDVETKIKSWIPSVSLGSGLSRSATPLVSTLTNPSLPAKPELSLWSLRGSLDMRLSLDPSLGLQEQKENLSLQSALLEILIQKKILWSGFQKSYFQIIAQAENLKYLEESLTLAQGRYELIKTQYERGLRSDLELLSAQIAASRDIPALQKARVDQEKRLLTLRQNLGLDHLPPLILTTKIPSVEIVPVLENVMKKSDFHPEYQRALIKKELSKVTRELGRSSRIGPTVGMSMGWSTGLNPLLETSAWSGEKWTDSLSLGFSLSLPLDAHIPGSTGNMALLKLDEEIQKQDLTLLEARLKAENELQSLVMDLEVSQLSREASELNLTLQSQNYRKIEESFEKGKSSLQELDTARQDQQKARLALETEKLNFLFLMIDLKVKMGE